MSNMAVRKGVLAKLKSMAKKEMAKGCGDDEEAGASLMAAAKEGGDMDEQDEGEGEGLAEALEGEGDGKEELTDEEKEILSFLSDNGRESKLPMGKTKLVIGIGPSMAKKGKA